MIGGIAHGTFDDIALQADWYTGDCVFEAPGEHKSPTWNGRKPNFTRLPMAEPAFTGESPRRWARSSRL